MLEVKRIHLYFRTCGNNIARSKQISWKSCSGKNNVKPCTKNCILFTNASQIHDFHCIYTLYCVYNITVNYTFRKSGILAKKNASHLAKVAARNQFSDENGLKMLQFQSLLSKNVVEVAADT